MFPDFIFSKLDFCNCICGKKATAAYPKDPNNPCSQSPGQHQQIESYLSFLVQSNCVKQFKMSRMVVGLKCNICFFLVLQFTERSSELPFG